MRRCLRMILVAFLVASLLFPSACTDKPSRTTGKRPKADKSEGKKKSKQVDVSGKPEDLLTEGRFWAYQIQEQEQGGGIKKLADSHYDMLVVDQMRSLKGEEDYDSKKDVSLLKQSPNSRGGRKLVLCYIDVGEAESYRRYWKDGWTVGNPEWIVAPDPGGWDENYPVKFWHKEWKSIMKEYVGRIIEDGYDGIYMDWLEVYAFEPVSSTAQAEGLDPVAELIKFVAELRDYAREKDPDFLFIAQNGAELNTFSGYTSLFEAIAQEAIWFDGAGDPDSSAQQGDTAVDADESQELIYQLEEWKKLGKPVLNVEYAQDPANAQKAYETGKENGFVTYVALTPLDRLTATPPPGYDR